MARTTHLLARLVTTLTLISAVVFSTAIPSRGQDVTTVYTSALTGSVIEATAPWTVDAGRTVRRDTSETVVLTAGVYSLVISYLPPDAGLVDARDAFLTALLDDFTAPVVIDRGAYGDVSYSLDTATVEGVRMGIFTLFLGEREHGVVEAYAFVAPAVLLASGIASLQAHVSVDGQPIFTGIDGEGLQALLTPGATPVATETPASADLGLAGEGRWVSPQFRAEVIWGPAWAPSERMREPVFSSATFHEDGIVLDWAGGAMVMLGVTVFEAPGVDSASAVESWVGAASGHGEVRVDVLLEQASGTTQAAMVSAVDPAGEVVAGIVEVSCFSPDCGTLVMVEMIGLPEAVGAAHMDAQMSVAIDGVPPFRLVSSPEIDAALDADDAP